jgi:hypothetical protein
MDPQVAWEQLQEAYGNADWETVHELAQALLDWLDRGGFPPTTQVGPAADLAEERTYVYEFCRSALQRAVGARRSE